MKIRTFSSALLVAFLFGCSSAPREVIYDHTQRQRTVAVEVFRDGNKPEKPYKEIGEIAYEDFGGEEPRVMNEMLDRARKLGANALIMQPRVDTDYQFNPFGRSGSRYMYKAIAVVYE
jgi:hypothetical protein